MDVCLTFSRRLIGSFGGNRRLKRAHLLNDAFKDYHFLARSSFRTWHSLAPSQRPTAVRTPIVRNADNVQETAATTVEAVQSVDLEWLDIRGFLLQHYIPSGHTPGSGPFTTAFKVARFAEHGACSVLLAAAKSC